MGDMARRRGGLHWSNVSALISGFEPNPYLAIHPSVHLFCRLRQRVPCVRMAAMDEARQKRMHDFR